MNELIPDFIEEPLNSPSEILASTSGALSNKTRGAVLAEVVRLDDHDFDTMPGCEFSFAFHLVGPLIENYRFTVCRFGHDISLYPVEFRFDNEISKELGFKEFSEKRAKNAEEVEAIFMQVFRTKRIASVVNSIRQLSKGTTSL